MAHRLRTIYDSGRFPSPLPEPKKLITRERSSFTDQIIVLKDGSVAETPGTHEQLINTGGVYSSLWAGEFSFPSLLLLRARIGASPQGWSVWSRMWRGKPPSFVPGSILTFGLWNILAQETMPAVELAADKDDDGVTTLR